MEIIIISSALLISAFVNIFFQKEFIKRGILDKVNIRSSHKSLATRSGGSSIFLSLFLISIYFYLSNNEIYDFSLLIPFSIMLVVGLYDDIYKLDFKLKFIFQIIVAKIIIDNGLIIDNLHGIFGIYELSRILGQLFTIFIIVAIINSINFIDGIDGLAISVVSIFLLSFELFSATSSDLLYLTLIILSSIVPLYFFNLRIKNKVFLGDSGSLLLGTVVSIYVLKILSQDYSIKPNYDLNKVIFVISILTYPIVDIIRIFILRLYQKKSPFLPDKQHIHHLILRKTEKHYLTTCIIVISSLIFAILIQIIF
jgi:UDP-N-acetylmuramyl pentapeptide phosphotransferase/UDP-N-acetylglucosamine-1-phosphate transferase